MQHIRVITALGSEGGKHFLIDKAADISRDVFASIVSKNSRRSATINGI
jgi:hypothetical protein